MQVSLTACVGPTFFTRKIRICSAKILKPLMIPLNSILIKAFNWQTLRKNNTCIILYREGLHGILRILDFGNEFSVAFINLGARLYNFTLVVSLRYDRVVKKPWRYQRKPRKDSLKCGNLGLPVQVPVLAHLWGRLFYTKDTYVQYEDFKTTNDPVKLNTH